MADVVHDLGPRRFANVLYLVPYIQLYRTQLFLGFRLAMSDSHSWLCCI